MVINCEYNYICGLIIFIKIGDETTISEVEMELVGELEKERRLHPLLENPENIGDKMEVSSETFLNFLHQNYPPFFGSTDDMRSAAEYLGDGDFILSGWKFDDSGNKSMKVTRF